MCRWNVESHCGVRIRGPPYPQPCYPVGDDVRRLTICLCPVGTTPVKGEHPRSVSSTDSMPPCK